MKIILDLKHSYNNYHWNNKEEEYEEKLKEIIIYLKEVF